MGGDNEQKPDRKEWGGAAGKLQKKEITPQDNIRGAQRLIQNPVKVPKKK